MTQDIPQHIAIIMDGNRRWATERGLPKMEGHTEGADNLRRIGHACITQGVKYLTVFALSTENLLKRGKLELDHLFFLMETLPEYLQELLDKKIQVRVIGDLSTIPRVSRIVLEQIMKKTEKNAELVLTLAINYGARDELVRAVKKLVALESRVKDVDVEEIEEALDTKDIPDPDLIIRTGGKQRLSNFLLWQAAYSELYFTDIYWPAFDEKELDKAIAYYSEVKKNFGK